MPQKRKLLLLSILLIAIAAVFVLSSQGVFALDGRVVQETTMYVQSMGLLGWLAFVLLYVLATVVAVPGTILTVISGYVFNTVIGFVLVVIGASLGAMLTFIISRYLFHDYFHRKFAHTMDSSSHRR